MANKATPKMREAFSNMLKDFRTLDQYELDEVKTVIKEDGKEGNMLHRVKTDAKYSIDDLLKEEFPDFFALAILQLYRKISGEIPDSAELPKALDVVKKGSKPDPELVLQKAEELLEKLIRSSDDEINQEISEYLVAYLTYRSRVAVVKEDR
jgi:hypothetical protein